jgi:hypothetical protein
MGKCVAMEDDGVHAIPPNGPAKEWKLETNPLVSHPRVIFLRSLI